ncbi:hypothetical protein AQS8620_03168 [Aquimixticola soesokkakensis]|uniref:Thioesterase domain-containing protein n=1 Tax=Aquimixticola soesokkakensis TaxID=1519096 RepID=A0A1Y5TQD5_9RHOB|nr:PaaI family thioesterase [Aquimixticola soesokkakensis]SLN67634.1 hypothetical protein AQS8620_03168 [Aquimixticola soesokkakensis]
MTAPDLSQLYTQTAAQAHLGIRLVAWETDFARFELALEAHHLNRQGLPFGGIHASLLDVAMGYAGCFTGTIDRPQHALTLNMNVSFIGRPQGQLLIAEGRRVGGGKNVFFAQAEVKDAQGALLATATGTFRYSHRAGAS